VKKIVVADDHDEVRKLVDLLLSNETTEVLHASSGEQALELTRQENPGLVILDLMMPGKFDGFATLQHLKDQHSSAETPVLVLSACNQQMQREKAFSLGAQGYLTKPFHLDSLVTSVQKLLAK
jgi:DNA-binding response OmpR family regulator